jgi:hypothetical protein
MSAPATATHAMDEDKRAPRPPRNLRTALVLLSIAAAFFAGVIAKYTFFS